MKLSTVVPVLRSFDEAKAIEFYVGFLGFKIDFQHRFEPALPLYMQVSRDGCVLHISEHHGDATPGSAVRVLVDDVDDYQRELIGKQYKNYRPGCRDEAWGERAMTVHDGSGNKLIFYTPKPKAP